jgi:UDP-glucose 4-epimerase
VYVEDIARANILAAKAPLTDEVFNVASGVETSLSELAQTLISIMGSTVQPVHGPERKVNPVPHRLADVSKARQLLGFETQVSLAEGLRRLVAWWQEKSLTADKIPATV